MIRIVNFFSAEEDKFEWNELYEHHKDEVS